MPPELTHNGWFLVFALAAPFTILGFRRYLTGTGRILIATLTGWPLLFLAVDRAWDLRVEFLSPNAPEEEAIAATADGANMICTLTCGWIPSGVYSVVVFGVGRLASRVLPRPRSRRTPDSLP